MNEIPSGLCQCGCGRPTNTDRRGRVNRFAQGHTSRIIREPAQIVSKFWANVDKTGDCWVWTGARYRFGHGRFALPDRGWALAHRFAYEHLVGPIPEGLHIDHLCRNPPCVNPDHLEPVPPGVNTLRGEGPSARNARKTHCQNGHEFTLENSRVSCDEKGNPRRTCKACDNDRHREQYVPSVKATCCKAGHEWTAENTRTFIRLRDGKPTIRRACRACDRRRASEYISRKKAS